MIKKILAKILAPRQIQILREIRRLYRFNVSSRLHSRDLTRLAVIYDLDKWGRHFYTTRYSEHFRRLRSKRLNILEIGAGGHNDTHSGGASLRMWKRYFPKSMIYSIDIYDKSAIQEKRIKIFRGDQADERFLKDVCGQTGPLDIIIDDGSHIVGHVITSFRTLFPFLKDGGIYVVEDTQTSYWPDFGGDSENLDAPGTSMNFFKGLADCLNYREFLRPGYVPTYFDMHITSIHFYHNLIFIYKGHNDEPSNMVDNGRLK